MTLKGLKGGKAAAPVTIFLHRKEKKNKKCYNTFWGGGRGSIICGVSLFAWVLGPNARANRRTAVHSLCLCCTVSKGVMTGLSALQGVPAYLRGNR